MTFNREITHRVSDALASERVIDARGLVNPKARFSVKSGAKWLSY